MIVVQGSDVLQYVWGKLTGTAQGRADLVAVEDLGRPARRHCQRDRARCRTAGFTPFNTLEAAAIALTVCVMGFFGGLVMSAIKRDRGVKDWGHMIEGHGGVLDRIDSLVFAAPVYFHVIRFWWT